MPVAPASNLFACRAHEARAGSSCKAAAATCSEDDSMSGSHSRQPATSDHRRHSTSANALQAASHLQVIRRGKESRTRQSLRSGDPSARAPYFEAECGLPLPLEMMSRCALRSRPVGIDKQTENWFYGSTAFVELFQTVELLMIQGRPGLHCHRRNRFCGRGRRRPLLARLNLPAAPRCSSSASSSSVVVAVGAWRRCARDDK